MADSKITALTALTAADPANDMIPIVDVSDTPPASGNTKRISINNILACSPSATLASATITGNLTVRTNALTVDANNNVGIGTTAPTVYTNYRTLAIVGGSTGSVIDINPSGGVTAGGLQIGCTAAATNIDAFGPSAGTAAPLVLRTGTFGSVVERYRVAGDGVATWSNVGGVAGTAMTLNFTGLGVGVASPSYKLDVSGTATQIARFANNLSSTYVAWKDGTSDVGYVGSGASFISGLSRTDFGILSTGALVFGSNSVRNMTLDASGNLLVGTTSGSLHKFQKAIAVATGLFEISSSSTASRSLLAYSADAEGWSANTPAIFIGKYSVTGRSINAGGTINASGADYAEYMVKCSDFVLAKGAIAGIDANGKLTNVFADAISFVVKSTDPSYVGNDKWGIDLEGDALEAARQLVDRIAFAGQVPVNVTGAKAGDYIVPVVDGTGIKGISVSNPTFEQYKLAVGKVIAIDADGRARIIVKVA